MMRIFILVILALAEANESFCTELVSSTPLPTETIKHFKVSGSVGLDCSEDTVFEEVFKLVSGLDKQHPLINDSDIRFKAKPVFLAWTHRLVPSKLQTAPKQQKRQIMTFKDTTVLEMLSKVASLRGRSIVDLGNGWFLRSSTKPMPKRNEIISNKELSIGSYAIYAYLPVDSIVIQDAASKDVLDFLNHSLRRTSKILYKNEPKIADDKRATGFQIKGKPDFGDSNTGRENGGLSCLGRVAYLDMIYLYGVVFSRKFTWSEQNLLQEHDSKSGN